MPSKIQLDENLWFLYICLQKSDLKTIDFNAVGNATSLKPPAARMRYTRLRRQIESGTLVGTHGTPFAGASASEKIAERNSKRKRSGGKDKRETALGSRDETKGKEIDRSETDLERVEPAIGVENKIKEEDSDVYGGAGDTTEGESDETDSWSSEDEIPLAKLKKGKGAVTWRARNVDSESRAEREDAPVRELEPEHQHQPQHQQQILPQINVMCQELDTGTMECYTHAHNMAQGERSTFAPGLPMHMYAPIPQHQMQATLPPFGETFRQSFLHPYQGGWGQFEDQRAGWSNSMEPLQGFSGWKPRKSV